MLPEIAGLELRPATGAKPLLESPTQTNRSVVTYQSRAEDVKTAPVTAPPRRGGLIGLRRIQVAASSRP